MYYFTGSDKRAQEHLNTTIHQKFNIGKFKDTIYEKDPEVYNALDRQGVSEWVYMWGATPGRMNIPRWEKLQLGDWMLVYSQKVFLYAGQVVAKLHSREIAEEVWGANANNETWEYIFFLSDLQRIDVPVEKFNAFFGYKPNFVAQGFNNIDEGKFNLRREEYDSTLSMIQSLSEEFTLSEEYFEDDNFQAKVNNQKAQQLLKENPEPKAFNETRKKASYSHWSRDPRVSATALHFAGYKCEVDAAHATFISKSDSHPFMEAHHLIPMNEQHKFEYKLDVVGNVVALCPNCHRMIHHASDKERMNVIKQLYDDRVKELEQYGLNVSVDEVLNAYFIEGYK
ncbi:HNH endonuclease [Marinococcus luteus]|uniref:HNH endonuclease n=1 Tax=Marinococcus luteus TaxID=1122204 RepID=UPI002ACC51CB|nr:HNH endonuclease [Marinococcus luteus]MDZ5782091.1 HNH endonuclease [Marinococcus luteus]